MNQNISPDKFRGMIWGAILGDVLGSAYEHSRKTPPITTPTPFLAKSWLYRSMHTDFTTITPPGHATDDTEMTIATLRAILANDFAGAYLDWGMTHCSFAGKNTRKYLFNITTLRGLHARIERFRAENAQAESNGFLMRASPLVLVADESVYYQSAEITGNYNENCRRALREYVDALKTAVAPRTHLRDIVAPTTRATPEQIAQRETKGWCECALFCVRDYLARPLPFIEAMRHVVSLGGDTDTNACIVGAMAGAVSGWREMMHDDVVRQNMDLILHCDGIRRKYVAGTSLTQMAPAYPARPEAYHPHCVNALIDDVVERWNLHD